MEGEPEVFQQDLVIQGEKVYEGLPVADFDVGLPDGALVWHQDGGNMTFDLAQDEALQGAVLQNGGRVNWDWSLGYIDIPLDLTSVTTDAEGFFLNLGVLGGLNGEFASDQYVNILLSESDAPFNDNTSNNAADIFATGMEVYSIRSGRWIGRVGGMCPCRIRSLR